MSAQIKKLPVGAEALVLRSRLDPASMSDHTIHAAISRGTFFFLLFPWILTTVGDDLLAMVGCVEQTLFGPLSIGLTSVNLNSTGQSPEVLPDGTTIPTSI